jgi:PPP family 3-phenylpropionic acid transporter
MVLTAWSTFHLPAPKMLATEPFFLNIRNLSTNPRWIGFLLAVFMASTCYSILNNFLVIYLDDLGAGEALYGLSIAAAGISEIPVYIFSTQLLRIVKPHRMLVIAFVALAVRGFVYALIHDPRWAVGAQLLHGPTFSTMWIAGVIYAKSTAPSGLGASAQSALGVMLFGFGAGAGALLGAWLYDGFGPQVAFHSAAGFALVGLTVFGLSEMRASSKANTAN